MINPSEKKSVALRYGQRDCTPCSTSVGDGYLAKRIEGIAQERGLPIEKESLLTDLLAILDAESAIPKDAHCLTSKLIAFLWRADRNLKKGTEASN